MCMCESLIVGKGGEHDYRWQSFSISLVFMAFLHDGSLSLFLSLLSLSSSLSSRQISPSGHFMRFVFQLIVGSEGVDVVCCSFLNRDSTQPERREKITLRMRLCSNLNLINTPQFREIQKEKLRRSEPNGKFSK